MTLDLRLAGPADFERLAPLFRAIERHYWGDRAPAAAAIDGFLRDTVLDGDHGCEIAFALREDRALGFASFTAVYPGPKLTGQMVMKDLFVLEEARGLGVGPSLMQFLAGLALERGCSRLDWTAETSNPSALAFYDRLGMKRLEEKVYYRLDGEGLAAFAKGRG